MDPKDEAVMWRSLVAGLRHDYGDVLEAEDVTLGETCRDREIDR